MINDNEKKADVSGSFRPTSTYNNLYDKSEHGNLEYPVSVYQIDLDQHNSRSIRWHWHEEMEILLIGSGYAKVTTDDEEQILTPGQGFILNQNVMHSIHSIEDKKCSYYSLVFHPDFLLGYTSS